MSVENGSCGSREALTLPLTWRLAQTVLALFPFSTNTFFTLPLAKCGIWWQAAESKATRDGSLSWFVLSAERKNEQ